MNKITKHLAVLSFIAGAGTLASCDDFLTIYPTSSIVEEDFWKDKIDLKNALMGCYKQIVSNEMLIKYIYWGEERSDNFERSSTTTANGELANIMNANLLPTYGQFDWTPAYKAINYCNKVLAHGPEVIKNDEAFSENEWKPIRAEVITLRAFCHFVLVRTFGEIPYVTEDFNNDSQDLKTAQSTQLQVLDNIIADLESIKDDAMTDYGNNVDNKGRVTRKAVHALLADVYLWRASYKTGNNQPFTNRTNAYGVDLPQESRIEEYSTSAASDYQKCIDYCDLIIEAATAEKIKKMNESGENIGGGELKIELEDLLEQNISSTKKGASSATSHGAYYEIFGYGNADESIFELQIEGSSSYNNGMIGSLIWNIRDSKPGSLTGSTALFEGIEPNPNNPDAAAVYTKTDLRRWENFQYTGSGQTAFNIGKYYYSSVQQLNSTSQYLTDNANSNLSMSMATRSASSLDANWIVYRMSEIYLMKAEAMTQLSEDEENLKSAFTYVREVFKRSNPYAYLPNNSTANNDSLKFASFNSAANMEKLIMAERQREFIAEGKRWYDLVRFALRRGNTSEMLNLLTRKYASNSKAIKSKLAKMQSLYSPVYNSDMKNNDLLYQNGVWAVNQSTSKTDNL